MTKTSNASKKAKAKQASSVLRGFSTTSIPKPTLDSRPAVEETAMLDKLHIPSQPIESADHSTFQDSSNTAHASSGCSTESQENNIQKRKDIIKKYKHAASLVDFKFAKTNSAKKALCGNSSIPVVAISANLENILFQYLSDIKTDQLDSPCSEVLPQSELELHQAYIWLSKIGFHSDDIEAAMKASLNRSIDSLLQWLCLHVPSKRLPFTMSDKFEHQIGLNSSDLESSQEIQIAPKPVAEMADCVNPVNQLNQSTNDDRKETNVHELEDASCNSDTACSNEQSSFARIDDSSDCLKESNLSDFEFLDYEDIAKDVEKKSDAAISDDDSSDIGSLMGALFDEEETIKSAIASDVPTSQIVHILDMSSPGWTGSMPRELLQQWIKKNCKGAEIVFYPLTCHIGSRFGLRFKHDRGPTNLFNQAFEMDKNEIVGNVADAKQFVATKALFHLIGSAQSFQVRNLPPPFANIWREWDHQRTTAAEDLMMETIQRQLDFVKSITALEFTPQKSDKSMDKISETPAKLLVSKQDDSTQMGKKYTQLPYLLKTRQESATFKNLLKSRSALPVYQHKSSIIETITNHQVVVLSGDTGSGKSTQVPHFILEQAIQSGFGASTNIICTQPRRISAISLAERVSSEIADGGPPGSQNSWIGYQARFENKTSSSTRLTFCTTGVLLKRMESNTMLTGISHVIVDEVHERTLDSDFLLFLLKWLLPRRPDLKVILMSATVDAGFFAAYFEKGTGISTVPCIQVPGKMFPVKIGYLEDAIQESGYIMDTHSKFSLQPKNVYQKSKTIKVSGRGGTSYSMTAMWEQTIKPSNDDLYTEDIVEDVSMVIDLDDDTDDTWESQSIYSASTLETVSRIDPQKVNYELIEHLIYHIISQEPECDDMTPGSILVFLPGISEIRSLRDALSAKSEEQGESQLWVLCLHGMLTAQEQSMVFESAPQGKRKVVLSTNVAETGITIPDIVYVIDSGRAREICYDERRKMRRLADILISKANCKQRAGRAGRVRPGQCFHLIPHSSYKLLPQSRPPEMLRLELEEICLRVRAILGPYSCCGSLASLFASMPEPPPEARIERSLQLLNMTKALDDNENLTWLGRILVNLPLDVRLGKMLLYSIFFDCIEPVLTICAVLSLGKSPFVRPFDQEAQASIAHAVFRRGNSDLLSYAYAYDKWAERMDQFKSASNSKRFCDNFFLSWQNLNLIHDTRTRLRRGLVALGFISAQMTSNLNSAALKERSQIGMPSLTIRLNSPITSTEQLVQSLFAAALYPNILVLDAPVKMHGKVTAHLLHMPGKTDDINIQKSSIVSKNDLKESGWYAYHAIKLEKARSVSGTDRGAVLDINETLGLSVVLFCGKTATMQPCIGALSIDSDQLVIKCPPRTCAGLMALRQVLEQHFDAFFKDPKNITDKMSQAKSCFKKLIANCPTAA
ncbi:hypothetical protein QVD99_005244 [Batrachochytrium dendrobatidis]|nr:hypothetical protein QVD99_005244 [Batrachochytrium dendrobatidis]